jgi:hypothetical protein
MTLYRAQLLANCDPDLTELWTSVGQDRDVVVIQGARSIAAERTAMADGTSSLQNPLDSKHVIDPVLRPEALATDVAPYPVDWKDIAAFQALGAFVKDRAASLGIAIVWGGDWVHLKDYDHFELVHAHAETPS